MEDGRNDLRNFFFQSIFSGVKCNVADILAALLTVHLIALCLTAVSDEFDDFLLCRQCGHDVVRFDSVVSIPSILSYRQRNDSIHGKDKVLIQLFRNPQGSHFEVITSKDADVLKVDKAYSEDSWFPGFTWTIAVCPRCGTHLGWVFEAVENYVQSDKKSFVGLILDKLLHQNYAESLLIIPKSYKS